LDFEFGEAPLVKFSPLSPKEAVVDGSLRSKRWVLRRRSDPLNTRSALGLCWSGDPQSGRVWRSGGLWVCAHCVSTTLAALLPGVQTLLFRGVAFCEGYRCRLRVWERL
jgi:hypothetical protein